jgi:hypothetical protein
MKAELVFNDLSVASAQTKEEARRWFKDMAEAIADLIDEDICERVLHANMDLYEIDLGNDYGYQEWILDNAVDRELRLLMQQLATKKPVQAHLKTLQTATDEFCRSEFKLKASPHQMCNALGVALLSDGIAVSLPSSSPWQCHQVAIVQYLYDDETLDNFSQISHQVRHVSSSEHIDFVIQNWRHSLVKKITRHQLLIEQWDTIFPYLDRCLEFEREILSRLQGETLKTALDRLWGLNVTCQQWQKDQSKEPCYPMYVRPESVETMKRYAKDREFTCPHQGQQHFVMHCNLSPEGYRLYWLVNKELKRFTIGYIGPHLPTKKYSAK